MKFSNGGKNQNRRSQAAQPCIVADAIDQNWGKFLFGCLQGLKVPSAVSALQ